MKIKREINGQVFEFELSDSERREAFEELQHIYDKQDILNGLESDYFEDKYGLSEKPLTDEEIEEAADLLRRYLENDDNWAICRDTAIEGFLRDARREQNS